MPLTQLIYIQQNYLTLQLRIQTITSEMQIYRTQNFVRLWKNMRFLPNVNYRMCKCEFWNFLR